MYVGTFHERLANRALITICNQKLSNNFNSFSNNKIKSKSFRVIIWRFFIFKDGNTSKDGIAYADV